LTGFPDHTKEKAALAQRQSGDISLLLVVDVYDLCLTPRDKTAIAGRRESLLSENHKQIW
jgi:hypothetical protein